MFRDASNFNQNLKSWNVVNIQEEPSNFSLNSSLSDDNLPIWGTTGEPEPEPEPTATACFTADAIVTTDQGSIPIEKVTTDHTIHHKPIKVISKTLYSQDRVVVIEKHTFGKNQPSHKTTVAPYHRFMINGRLQQICNLVDGESIYYTKYRQAPLYNIILETHDLMQVNNMQVETLDPSTLIAKVFDGSLTKEKRNQVIRSINLHHKRVKANKKSCLRNYMV